MPRAYGDPLRCRACGYTHQLQLQRQRDDRKKRAQAAGREYQPRCYKSSAREEALRKAMHQQAEQRARRDDPKAVRSENRRRYRAWLISRFGVEVVAPTANLVSAP